MQIAGRELSFYELHFSSTARWYWDVRYITEAELERLQPSVPASLLEEVDAALSQKYTEWRQKAEEK